MHGAVRLHGIALRKPLSQGAKALPSPATAVVRVPAGQLQRRGVMGGGEMAATLKQSVDANPVAWWLFGCAGLVATTLTVGAAARLTRSGASMLYWVPNKPFPPRSDDDWQSEFESYREFSHRHQRRPMTLDDFKHNFKYEYMHRLLGEGTALAFLAPLGYLYAKSKLPTSIHAHLAGVLALGATQMFLGRKMVKENVLEKHRTNDNESPTFLAPHGLTFHNAFSMANMALLLWAGFHVVSPASRAVKVRELTMSHALKDIGELRRYFQYVTALFVGTAAAGTMVAGIDAGKEFNTFPKMGDTWIPNGLFEKTPWLRNLSENVALVQLDHRLLAISTLGAYSFVYMMARKPHIWDNLPPESKKALTWTMVAVGGQFVGGATMLVNAVPTTLAMAHQSGAAAILGTSLWSLYTLRFARPSGMVQAAKVASKVL